MTSPGQTQASSTITAGIDSQGNAGEEVVAEYYPAATPSRGANRVVLVLLIVMGFPFLFFFGLGLLLWVAAIVYYIMGRRSGGSLGPVKYGLSNKRVWTEEIRNPAAPVIIEQANLMDVSPNVMNKVNTKYSERGQSSSYEISGFVGDVVFIDDRSRLPRVRFLHVSDPDGIKETVGSIKKSYGGA